VAFRAVRDNVRRGPERHSSDGGSEGGRDAHGIGFCVGVVVTELSVPGRDGDVVAVARVSTVGTRTRGG
jgi:hypothetical protein